MKTVRVRVAPSPTGDPHVGTAYIAFFNYIFAKHYNGTFILRIEDTDQSRSRPEYEQTIIEALQWIGLDWHEGPDVGGKYGPYRQSERFYLYREYCQKLLDCGHAYKCFATKEELEEMREVNRKLGQKIGYDRRYRNLSQVEVEQREKEGQSYVVRLKVPLTGECVINDRIKGRIVYQWSDIEDQIILKSDGFPTYHLANVVDDHLMKITHVIRGDEWISSTPKHILLYQYFGWEHPEFIHMPLLLGKDGRKLSKRRNPTSIFFYRDTGYLPTAFVNFLSLMGYSMGDNQEIYSVDELIKSFNVDRIGASGAFFDLMKLDWINQHYLIHSASSANLWEYLKGWQFNDRFMNQLMPMCQTRIKTLSDFMELCGFFFIRHVALTEKLLLPFSISRETGACMIQAIIWHMDQNEDWSKSGIENASKAVAKAFTVNHKKVIMRLLFVAITGKISGPPLFQSIEILGKYRTRARLLAAIEFLGGLSGKQYQLLEKHWKSGDCTLFVKPNTSYVI